MRSTPSLLARLKPHKRPSLLPQRPLPPNRFRPPRGQNKVFLPNFTVTLVHTPHAAPHFATFLTPLWLNKLDLKDYLYHLYGLQALSVRSYVIQRRVRQNKWRTIVKRPRVWFRPASKKKMTVELVQGVPGNGAFVWPDAPTDFQPWGKAEFDEAAKSQMDQTKRQTAGGEKMWPKDMKSLAEKAKELLKARKS